MSKANLETVALLRRAENALSELSGLGESMAYGVEELQGSSRHVAGEIERGVKATGVAKERLDSARSELARAQAAFLAASASYEDIRARTEDLSAGINVGAEAASRSYESSRDLRQIAQVVREKTQAQAQRAKQVVRIVEIIEQLAWTTKLLSLNATIEAQRAGAAGLAFGVVAGEVKELSKKTTDAAGRIREEIEILVAATREVQREAATLASRADALFDVSARSNEAVNVQTTAAQGIVAAVTSGSQELESANPKVASALDALTTAHVTVEGLNTMMQTVRDDNDRNVATVELLAELIQPCHQMGPEVDAIREAMAACKLGGGGESTDATPTQSGGLDSPSQGSSLSSHRLARVK